jgi:glyoxylase-like metal-dependent hydrolase (beta-lactamase superfamily II)
MPQWVINTHWHFDHTDGNAAFAAAGATILAHANGRARLSLIFSAASGQRGTNNTKII